MQETPLRPKGILEDPLRGSLPPHPPPSIPMQQHTPHAMPLRGPTHGRLLGVRSATPTGHIPHPHGAVSPDGGPGFRQGVPVLPQGDQHDVRGGAGHSHSGGALQSPHQGGPASD